MDLFNVMARGFHGSANSRALVRRMHRAIAGAFIAIVLGGAAFYFWDRPGSIDTATTVATAPAILTVGASFPPAPAFSSEQHPDENAVSVSTERPFTDQPQREQAAAFADRMRRVAEELKRTALKAAGVNRPVPLDQDDYIPMPGGGVWVKVHDSDATGFDVSINHERWRQVPKQERISHSETDETLIYSNGSASLFYVSQVSAGLNHCLLRVREN
jgi:hypothetical protein